MNDIYEEGRDYTTAEKYEKGWIISSNDAKKLFMLKIVEMAEDVVERWNALSEEIIVDADKFTSMARINFGWMSADNLQKITKLNVIYVFSEYINTEFGYFHNIDEIAEFFGKTNVEFWAGDIDFKKFDTVDSYYYNMGEASQIITKILVDLQL